MDSRLRIVAVMALTPSGDTKGLELAKLFVDPEVQGKEVGQQITDVAVEYAKSAAHRLTSTIGCSAGATSDDRTGGLWRRASKADVETSDVRRSVNSAEIATGAQHLLCIMMHDPQLFISHRCGPTPT